MLHLHLKPDLINPISNLGLGFLSPEKFKYTEAGKGTFWASMKNLQAPQETISCQSGLKVMKVIHFFHSWDHFGTFEADQDPDSRIH